MSVSTLMTHDFGQRVAADAVRLERRLPGPAERVWRYLTESDLRAQWLGAGAVEPRVGGAVEHVFHNDNLSPGGEPPPPAYANSNGHRVTGEVTVYDPPHQLAYTWRHASGATSEVSFELTPDGPEVLLVVTHRRLPTRDALRSVSTGWHAHLEMLRARLAAQGLPDFWKTFRTLESEYAKRIE